MSTTAPAIVDLVQLARRRRNLPAPDVRRLLRKQARLSQLEVAHALGVSQAAVSLWEAGEREPRGELRDTYAQLLDQFAKELVQ